ncbi:MAG TPA: HAD family hydrolase [Fimbriimonadaceae bacterium]|nr:HAD family hydrolase [Fimbriimonadaceae bacterium]
MRVRGITFDFDGTLADTLPVCYSAFRRVFRTHLGREYSDAEIHEMFGPCEKGVIQAVLAEWEPAFEMFLREYERAHGVCVEPFPGIVEMLDDLERRHVPVAIVTGKGPESAAISLRLIGLADRFEIVEAGSPSGPVKPEAIRRILGLWGFEPSEVAHVGDSASDIRSARECGTIAIAAAWAPRTPRPVLAAAGPDEIFDSVADFRDWVLRSPIQD